MIKTILDVGDNLFSPDPSHQQRGNMARICWLSYIGIPGARMGSRIQNMRMNGELMEAEQNYNVARRVPVAEACKKRWATCMGGGGDLFES